MSLYPPAEDSYLIQKHIPEFAQGRVLDMGTGSGILTLSAIRLSQVREVVAADKNPEAITALKKKIKEEHLRKITPIESDLFSAIQGSFEVILCNPPYLPQDEEMSKLSTDHSTNLSLYGGKKGWEFTEKFFHEAGKFLFPGGKILYLFSSLTNKKKVEEIITRHLFTFRELERKKIAFEELYLYLVEKPLILQELERKGIEDLCYLAQGKRGQVFTGVIDQNRLVKSHISKKLYLKVCIKIKHPESQAEERIENETKWLQLLNKSGIGPRYLFSGKGYLAYQYVEGTPLMQWITTAEKKEIILVLQEILKQCSILDQRGINKEEMHHPIKHILIDKDNFPWMIDFERCTETEKPKNVTQFLEFLRRISPELEKKGVKIVPQDLTILAQKYKKEHDPEAFRAIVALLS
ncbi:methyltransferase [Candidatus Woesearchaeota archaeon]|nr:methyltransferase [Candidatus Woesearchaeota archaeon]